MDERKAICSQVAKSQEYIFQGKPKKGKVGTGVFNGSPIGESYRCFLDGKVPTSDTPYTAVPMEERLLPPGNYSWWSAEPVKESPYGQHKFFVGFKEILAAFQNSCGREGQVPHLMFRKAGTLRYTKEICYVILVHACTDDVQHICHLPLLTDQKAKFDFAGVLDGAGVVKQAFLDGEVQPYPRFKKEYDKDPHSEHWEHLAFAFYRSSEDPLRIPQNNVQITDTVRHTRCMKKIHMKCPDEPD